MSYYEELQKYEKQIARKKEIKSKLPELKDKHYELCKTSKKLEKKKSQKAVAEYNAVLTELEAVGKDIRNMEYDLEFYINAEKNYEEALKKWMDEVASTSMTAENAEEIIGYQRRLEAIQKRKSTVRETKLIAEKATANAELILTGLQSARSWGLYEALAGGLAANLAKYERIDDVEENIKELNMCLHSLRIRLKNTELTKHVSVIADKDTKFADIYFDNVFTDWEILDSMKSTKQETLSVLSQLAETTEYIEKIEAELLEEETAMTEKIANALKGRQ